MNQQPDADRSMNQDHQAADTSEALSYAYGAGLPPYDNGREEATPEEEEACATAYAQAGRFNPDAYRAAYAAAYDAAQASQPEQDDRQTRDAAQAAAHAAYAEAKNAGRFHPWAEAHAAAKATGINGEIAVDYAYRAQEQYQPPVTAEERTARVFARHAYAATIAAAAEVYDDDHEQWQQLESTIILADDAAIAAAAQILSYTYGSKETYQRARRAALAATYEAHKLSPTLVEQTDYPHPYGTDEVEGQKHTAAAQAHGIYTGPVDEQTD